ncbi:MazG-like family protein [Ancylobacter mangrovi]|uniref:MazG-like family protein n=1 Tax=Ancylobacter mangrovi TaxID=2972472 RepID=UPI0021622A75|nr:MazG-like family protein [Ancylobacter mangrovi]MCS0501563.1 MazG-like family protein [Ancylobacter mangrovi]
MSADLTFAELQAANLARQAEWCPDDLPDLSFRGNELAGEVGEACNVIKKLERARHGWRGSRASLDQLAEELADVVICANLVAITAGIDLGAAVIRKFNATSMANGLQTKLQAEPMGCLTPGGVDVG